MIGACSEKATCSSPMHRRSNAAGLKSVVHFEVLFFGIDDEVIVDPDLADSLATTA
jgi:hypothetical protein